MAAPMHSITQAPQTHGNVTIHYNNSLDDNLTLKAVSTQLLYPDRFAECYQENNLLLLKESSSPEQSVNKTVHLPPSSVLSRLKDFLPQMLNSNQDLASRLTANPEDFHKFDIENIDNDQTHIEMNLSLVPENLLDSSDSEDSGDSSETESSSSQCSGDEKKVHKLEIKLTKTSKNKPVIQELNSVDFEAPSV